MANILSISSQVVRGAVGNSIGAFALQRLGHTVWQIPTVLLSNHPGHGVFSGHATDAEMIAALWDGVKTHGWHRQIDAVLTGYIPSAASAHAIATIVEELKAQRDDLVYLCDPAIGDEPKGLYVDAGAAAAIRDGLMPEANLATPNRFELSWLTDAQQIETFRDAIEQSRGLAAETVITTSVPGGGDNSLTNVLTNKSESLACSSDRFPHAPNGTGDLFAALFLGFRLSGTSLSVALSRATSGVGYVVGASQHRDVLAVQETQSFWSTPTDAAIDALSF